MNRNYIALLAMQSLVISGTPISTHNDIAYEKCIEYLAHKGAHANLLNQKTRRAFEQSLEAAGEQVDEEKLFQNALTIARHILLNTQTREQIMATCRRLQEHPSATK